MRETPIKYKSSSPAGDLISMLPGIKQMYETTGRKALIYQRLGMQGVGMPNAIHPFQNDHGEEVCFNDYMFDMMRPLLLAQPYVEDFMVYSGEAVDVDFDLIRMERFTNQPLGSINRWPFYVFPEMNCDLSVPWLHVPPQTTLKVIINFTQRYRNYFLTYYFLKPHQDRIVFAGLGKERDAFCKQWGLDIPLLEVDHFWDLAQKIKGCNFFIGNQSMCFQLAEAMKIPRMLEVFQLMPNVIPHGKNAYDYYHQQAAEFYFNKLLNNESKESKKIA